MVNSHKRHLRSEIMGRRYKKYGYPLHLSPLLSHHQMSRFSKKKSKKSLKKFRFSYKIQPEYTVARNLFNNVALNNRGCS